MAVSIATSTLNALPQVRRAVRSPQHPFFLKHAPYEIQPFLIAPVLPGETLKSASFQSRVITNPLKAPLIGWWLEYYFFYVKHRDIDYYNGNTILQDMAINAGSLASHADYQTTTADPFYYFGGGAATRTGMNWVRACLKPIITTYFRDEGGAWDQVTIDGNPAAYVQGTSAFDSTILESSLDTAVDVAIPVDAAPSPDTVSVRDIISAMENYELLVQQNLVNVTYEDWLRSYGVRVQNEIVNKPELLRYVRQFTYPGSHVIPDTTTAGDSEVTSACSWTISERISKSRFFREPGFIVGVTVSRPKVYLGRQTATLAGLLDDAKSWLPAVLMGDPAASWKKVTDAATDVINGAANSDWWIDLKDLFLYGEQYVNKAFAGLSDANLNTSPPAAMTALIPVQASVDSMFVSGDATSGVRQDGIVRLYIESHLRETSPRGAVAPVIA